MTIVSVVNYRCPAFIGIIIIFMAAVKVAKSQDIDDFTIYNVHNSTQMTRIWLIYTDNEQ